MLIGAPTCPIHAQVARVMPNENGLKLMELKTIKNDKMLETYLAEYRDRHRMHNVSGRLHARAKKGEQVEVLGAVVVVCGLPILQPNRCRFVQCPLAFSSTQARRCSVHAGVSPLGVLTPPYCFCCLGGRGQDRHRKVSRISLKFKTLGKK